MVKWRRSGGQGSTEAAGEEGSQAPKLLLAINPFRVVGGPKGRLFRPTSFGLIWSRPAKQGCQAVVPSGGAKQTADRPTPATVPSGPRTHTKIWPFKLKISKVVLLSN